MDDQEQVVFFQLVGALVVGAIVLLAAKFVKNKRGRTRQSAQGSGGGFRARLAIFVIGVAAIQVLIYLSSLVFSYQFRWDLETSLRAGIVWMIVYEIIYRTRRLTAATFPVYVLLTWALETPLYIGFYLVSQIARGVDPSQLLEFYSSPLRWLPHSQTWQNTVYDFIEPVLLVGVSYFLIHRSFSTWQSKLITDTGGTGYGGIEMTPAKSQTTRFLCASAFLLGTSYRHKVLDYLEDENRAVAPEPGVDLELVAQVCRFAEKQALKYYLLFPAILVSGWIVALINPIVGAVLLILATAALYFYKEYHARNLCEEAFGRDTFDPAEVKNRFPAQLDEKMRSALPAPEQNLVVYSQFSPFVGAGISLGGWSFAINVEKPKEDAGQHSLPVRFQIQELYSGIEEAIVAVGLNGLTVSDTFFVHGTDIRNDKVLLPFALGRPRQHLDTELANGYITRNDPRVRHYKWVRVNDWGNELVTSYFFRCSLRGSNMFVEINRYLLTAHARSQEYRRIG